MCRLSIEYCIVCRNLVSREFTICRDTKDRFICVDYDAYEDNNQFVVIMPDGSLKVDLTRFVRTYKYDTTCKKCTDIGVENVFRDIRERENMEYNEYVERPYGDTGYYSDDH
jgi:hypothetical protein